jgi:hypothetical protein
MDKDVSRIVHIIADLSVDIKVVFAEMKYQRDRLSWSKEDLREYCIRRYQQTTFLALTDAQISELYFYLDSLPDNTPMSYQEPIFSSLAIQPLTIKRKRKD